MYDPYFVPEKENTIHKINSSRSRARSHNRDSHNKASVHNTLSVSYCILYDLKIEKFI